MLHFSSIEVLAFIPIPPLFVEQKVRLKLRSLALAYSGISFCINSDYGV